MEMTVDRDAALRGEQRREARITLIKLLLIIPVMLAFCATLVPLYRQICQVLGISATQAVATNTQVDASRSIRIEFDANLGRGFGWQFAPVERGVTVHPGAMTTINYRVTNTLPHATTGRAVPSFGPLEAGQYFQKVECFCFNNQTLQAGETRDMPVSFYIDPKMPRNIEAIALSYTFFDVTDGKKRS
jgi:cytochrome c oxidase assembly protein subunit 11